MPKSIVALFNDATSAQTARQELTRAGFRGEDVEIEGHSSSNASTRLVNLRGAGLSDQLANAYCEGLRRGGALLVAKLEDSNVSKGQQILQRAGAVNVESRMAEWRKAGWTKFDANSKPYTEQEATSERKSYATNANAGEYTLPVIEEELRIGKREVQGGGVRVKQTVTEQPVEEQISLHEEHVHVERRPVDRSISAADINQLQDQTIEVTERREEAVVDKQARVKEEVVISKDQQERTETVRDTVKRTDVTVEEIDSKKRDRGR